MSRFSRYDSDEERLPHGMTRVGYDADSQVYTFQDADGSYWESAPGSQYGRLTQVSGGGEPEYAGDTEPFLMTEDDDKTSWRHELMPLLNFGVIIGLSLLLLFWYLHYSAASEKEPLVTCVDGSSTYVIKSGDTCWSLGQDRSTSVEEILKQNPLLDCDKLGLGTILCLPN